MSDETPRTLQQAEDELEVAESLAKIMAQRMELAQMLICSRCELSLDLCTEDHPVIHVATCELHAEAPYLRDYIASYTAWAEKHEGDVATFMEQLESGELDALLNPNDNGDNA